MCKWFLSGLILLAAFSLSAQETSGREKLLMDFDWKFAFGHPYDTEKDFKNGTSYFSYFAKAGYGDGAAARDFDDRAWRSLNLPHDWAAETAFDQKGSLSHGYRAVGRNFPETSVGWYRKTFSIPESDIGKRISVVFDGVFRNSIVWVNGHYLGTEKSGYNQFEYDITDLLNYGGDNVIAVRVDATMEEGWFYEGAGIYRHVWLLKTSPIHIPLNGTFVVSEVKGNSAAVHAKTDIINEGKEPGEVNIIQRIVDAEGKVVAEEKTPGIYLVPFETKEISVMLEVPDAKRWELDAPYLYKLVTSVVKNNKQIDAYETTFGIRTIRFDAKEGFFLNGKPVKLKGSNNHQDHAGVGAALPDELHYWRIKTLKEMGQNAYRCSHNPPAPELLDACDRIGIMVIDENRLMRNTSDGLNDLKKMILRDRNHPSVICWSIGNEEWGIENTIVGERIATTMQNYVKSLDTTRPVTAGVSGGFQSGISSVLEVMGYNYLGNGDIEAHYKRFPDQPGMGTEEGSTFSTRGIYVTDNDKHYQASYDRKPRPTFYSIEEGWTFYAERPNLAGVFFWTGFDYRGEPTPYTWPSNLSYFGMFDLCGFPKDNVYYLKSWWSDEPVLHILPHWTWPEREGESIDVWVYSNCEEVELFLNKKSLGKKKMKLNSHLEWKVNYTPGTLKAVGYRGGEKIMEEVVRTTGAPDVVKLTGHKNSVNADGEDVIMVTVEALDKKGLPVPVASNEITFSIEGPGEIIGVGNGDQTSLEKEKFVDNISTVAIKDLQETAVNSAVSEKKVLANIEDFDWKEAFIYRDYDNLPETYIHRGVFVLPEDFSSSQITLFHKNICTKQAVYINGHNIARDLKESDLKDGFVIDRSILNSGENSIVIIGTPIPKKHQWDVPNRDPGLIQIITPSGAWKRKLFSGRAQVIVQATQESGEITLTASSPGLKSGGIKLKTNAVDSRPKVK